MKLIVSLGKSVERPVDWSVICVAMMLVCRLMHWGYSILALCVVFMS